MSFKSFREQDLIYTTLKTHPEYNFIVNNKVTYLQKEKTAKGNLSNQSLRHIPTGSVSLYELNIDRGQKAFTVISVNQAPLFDNRTFTLVDAEGFTTTYTIDASLAPASSGGTGANITVGTLGLTSDSVAGRSSVAAAIAAAINNASSPVRKYTAVANANKVTVTQKIAGPEGNKNNTNTLANLTVPNFQGGGTTSSSLISLEVPLRDESGGLIRPFSMTRDERINANPNSTVTVEYPLSASIGRIYVGQDINFKSLYSRTATAVEGGRSGVHSSQVNSLKHPKVDPPSANRKYVTALENLLSQPDDLQQGNFENYKLGAVNMICIPGVFSGSGVKKGSVKLDYYVAGSLIASAQDKFSNGKVICTEGPDAVKDTQIGTILYNQGLILLTSSDDLHSTYTDYYYDTTTQVKPSWLNFGSGLSETGDSGLNLSSLTDKSSYVVNFKGTNKIPTLTMFAFSERGEHNFSNNPTFLENKRQGTTQSLLGEYALSANSFTEKEANINKINKSEYQDASDSFKSTTYISKVGIYDEDKNLIAVATLANPIKKTEKRDFMIKMKIDF